MCVYLMHLWVCSCQSGKYLYRTVNEKMQLYFQSASMMMLNYFCFAVNKGYALGGIEYPFVHISKCLLCGDRTNKCNKYSVCPML